MRKRKRKQDSKNERETTLIFTFIICCSEPSTLFCESKDKIIRFYKPIYLHMFKLVCSIHMFR